MTAITRSTSRCTNCLRDYAFTYLKEARRFLGAIEHVRGKKKSTRGPLTIACRLTKDIPGYGAAGHIIPLAPGYMRNQWYPQGKAEYVTGPELQALRRSKTVLSRDFTFGVEREEVETEETPVMIAQQIRKPVEKPRGPTPERSIELFNLFIPGKLEFWRQVIVPEPEASSSRTTGLSGIAAELFELRNEAVREAEKEKQNKVPLAIYGSVSTQDVFTAMKTMLGRNDEAAQVALQEEDIMFVSEDTSRVKEIGTFKVNIKLRGTDEVQERTIKVNAQDSQA